MFGVLATPLQSHRSCDVSGRGGYFTHTGSALRLQRAPLDRGIRRTTECPCAVRLYHITGQDIAARSEYCSLVLGAPSVGISQAAQPIVPSPPPNGPESVTAHADSSQSFRAASPAGVSAVERPIAVQVAWADTTVWEVALTALQVVRLKVDAAYKAAATSAVRQADGCLTTTASVTRDHWERDAEEDNGNSKEGLEEAQYSAPLPRYQVELLTGTVDPEGRASLVPLCTVSCRQVVHCHTALLPMRRGEGVDYNTALYELPYNLGDPVFVACTRIQ